MQIWIYIVCKGRIYPGSAGQELRHHLNVNFIFNRYVQSWIDTREVQSERANLLILFDKYVPLCLETMKHRFKKITPIVEISHIQMLCFLLECLLVPANTPPDCPKELYELYFVFACVWAFGGCTFQDQVLYKVNTCMFCYVL